MAGRKKQEHCIRGHILSATAVYISSGKRICKECHRIRAMEQRHRLSSSARQAKMASEPHTPHLYAWEADMGVDLTSQLPHNYGPYACQCPEILAATGIVKECAACQEYNKRHPINPSQTEILQSAHEEALAAEAALDPVKRKAQLAKQLELLRSQFWDKKSLSSKIGMAIHRLEARRVELGGKPIPPTNLPGRGRAPILKEQHPHDVPKTMEEVERRLALKRQGRADLRPKIHYLATKIAKLEEELAAMDERKPRTRIYAKGGKHV